jgi:hypothetical protein
MRFEFARRLSRIGLDKPIFLTINASGDDLVAL